MAGILVRAVGQVGIAGGGQDTMVAEDFLDFEQVNASFDQMRGVAVTQTVRANLFFKPQS